MLSLIELLSQGWNYLPGQLPQFAWVIQCLQVVVALLAMIMVTSFVTGANDDKSDEKVNWVWVATKELIGFNIFLPYWYKNRKANPWMTLEPEHKRPGTNGSTNEYEAAAVIPSYQLSPYLASRPDFMGVKLRQFEQKLNASYLELIRGELFWQLRAVIVAYRNHKKVKRMHKMLEEIEVLLNLESYALIAQEIIKQRQTQLNQDKMEISWMVGMDKLQTTFERLGNLVEKMSEDKQAKEEFVRFFAKELVIPRIKHEIVSIQQTLSPEEEQKLRLAIIQQAQATLEVQEETFE